MYELVFDGANNGIDLLFIILGIIYIVLSYFDSKKSIANAIKKNKYVKYIKDFSIFLFLFIFLIFNVYSSLNSYYSLQDIVKNKEYHIIEGKVKNFKPTLYWTHSNEVFYVKDVKFEYSDSLGPGTYYYNNTKSHGGAITHDGQEVKIYYIKDKMGQQEWNRIIKLFIKVTKP